MDGFEATKKLIANNQHIAEFADFGNGCSPEWVKSAEEALDFSFPPTYRWWLLNYGGGEIGGEEIFSIYEEDFDSVVGGDIVYMYRNNSDNPMQIPICHSDVDGVFYFDRSANMQSDECPIVSAATNTVYAADFIEFLEKRIAVYQ